MAKMLDCGLKVREFKFQAHYYIHFQTNTLGKGITPNYRSNSNTNVVLQGWLWYKITHEGWYAIKQRNQRHQIIKLQLVYTTLNPF